MEDRTPSKVTDKKADQMGTKVRDRQPDQEKTASMVIRTPAGIPHTFEVKFHDRVDITARDAVKYFVGQGQWADEAYGLALVQTATRPKWPTRGGWKTLWHRQRHPALYHQRASGR